MRALAISLLLISLCAAQEIPLGDLAKQERARREAAAAASFKLGKAPPTVAEGESIAAHFLTIRGEAAEGEFAIKLNGNTLFHNSYVRDLPIYVSSQLLDGGNLLEVSLMAGQAPIEITIEERKPGNTEREVLVRFLSDANDSPIAVDKQLRFQAHPKLHAPLQIHENDRAAITRLVTSFYDALNQKDRKGVLTLFVPAIEEAREIYPEGARYGQEQMEKMAGLLTVADLTMEPFDAAGLEMNGRGATVVVRRPNRQPVFASNEVAAPGGGKTSISAESVLVKKIKGQWRLTLPFGF